MLTISPETVCYIIVKAREFDAKESVVEEDLGSNPADEDARGVLEDYPDDPTAEELRSAIQALNTDQQADLVALAWIGRGDFVAEQWEEALAQARDSQTPHTARYLMGMPLLGDYLEEGLAALGYSCAEYELGHL